MFILHKHFWNPYTFVRIVIFFIGGILLGIYFPDSIRQAEAIFIFVLLILLYGVLYITNRINSKYSVNPGIVGLLVVFIAGYCNVLFHTDNRKKNHLTQFTEQVQYYKAVVASYPEAKNKSWKLEADIQQVKTENGWQNVEAKIYLYFPKNGFEQPFRYGDVLFVKGFPRELSEPANPGEFDYKRFLAFRNIYHQQFIREDEVIFLGNHPPNVLLHRSMQARYWGEKKLQTYIKGEQEQAIALALVLGIKDGLDNELVASYAASGAMHVLAVSGLHVGILYFFVSLILKPLKKKKNGRILFAIISIAILWAYACITALSPSILRAVTMFTCVAIGQAVKQRTNIYNTLAISAFILLLFSPQLIMSVGFQLSYLAVLGIVSLHRPAYLLLEPKTWLGDLVWKTSSVSIAAQVATFSLGLLYFHQFPNYFLVANLFVIPLAFAVMVLGLLVLAFSVIQTIATWLGILLSWIVKLLNLLVVEVEALPFSLVENIYITTFQCWILIVGIITVLLLIYFRKAIYLYGVFSLFLVLSISQWYHFQQHVNRPKLTVYNVPGHIAYDITDRGKNYFFCDSSLKYDVEKIRFHINPNRLISGVQNRFEGNLCSNSKETPFGRIVVWSGKTIFQITRPVADVQKKFSVDYVVLSNNAIRHLDEITKYVDAKEIILDSSNSPGNCEKLLNESTLTSANVYSVLHSGAFQVNL